MRKLLAIAGLAFALAPAAARAEPGLAGAVYDPNVVRGETELELRAGVLDGGADDGDWQVKAEFGHAFTDWWRPALIAEWEHENGDSEFTAFAIENVFDFTGTRDWPVHFGAYAEYEFAQDGPDGVEFKLLMQRQRGPLDLRLNLITEREVGAGAGNDWEFGYAAQIGFALNDDLELGLQGFGDAGTDDDFGDLGDQPHYWGPFVQFELGDIGDGEIELQASYLAGLAESAADGQFRLTLAYEFAGAR
ncbi:MAG: hypothetical protein R3C16_06295 [Hyphomonadaceae bacterium]